MKKVTFILMAALMAVVCYAQKPMAKVERLAPLTRTGQMMQNAGTVQTQRTLDATAIRKAPRKAAED